MSDIVFLNAVSKIYQAESNSLIYWILLEKVAYHI